MNPTRRLIESLKSRRTALTLLLFALLPLGCTTSGPTVDTVPVAVDEARGTTDSIALCPVMSVSNAPGASALQGSGLVCMNNIELQLAPAPGACLSSGFGQRSGRVHKGLDYYSKPAVAVIAAADGKVIAVKFRAADYGNWVIIDHGEGVYTSYAHLANVEGDITSGAVVKRGQVLGMMGNSGDATSAIHLHYEVATGDYNNPKAWFGLTPRDPFRLAARCG